MINDVPSESNRVRRLFRERFTFQISIDTYHVPQGLAVYQNGVRINEVFGDTVNWDFLPAVAVNTITVISNNVEKVRN